MKRFIFATVMMFVALSVSAECSRFEITADEPLTENETTHLLTMWEEEKMARDVYQKLFEKWGLKSFRQISMSEQRHMDLLKKVIDAHKIDAKNLNETSGVFQNPELQKYYDDFVLKGSESIEKARETGVAIEELDIADLKKIIGQTQNTELKKVYEQLVRGSEKHLNAFSKSSGTGQRKGMGKNSKKGNKKNRPSANAKKDGRMRGGNFNNKKPPFNN